MAVSTLAAIGLGLSALASGANVIQASNARGDAEKQAAEQKKSIDEQNRLLDEEQKRLAKQQADEQAAQQAEYTKNTSRSRQRARARGATGFGDTLLTGPQGVTSQANTAIKTLLGT